MVGELTNIMARFGSDKGTGHHNYTNVYYELLNHLVDKPGVNVFELGIGTNNPDLPSSMGVNGIPGASLRGWREWFKQANIFAGDIDKDILVNEEKISSFYVDQRSKESIEKLWEQIDEQFDVIIDDGLHEFDANDIFVSNSHHKLKTGGIFIIEDIHTSDELKVNELLPKFSQWFSEVKYMPIPHEYNTLDNNILILRK